MDAGRAARWLRRGATVVGAVLVLGSIPAATSAQSVEGFVGYNAAATGTALTAFPSVPALLPAEVPIEGTISLATATLSSGGTGFGRASTFFPGTFATGARQLIETASGTRLPLPDYPIVVEAREFEEAKRSEIPGVTMTADVDPARAVAVADTGAIGVPAVVGVRSMRTESRVELESDSLTSISTTTVSGIDVAGVLSIGALVSTAKVVSDGETSTCSGGVTLSGVTVAGSPATLDDEGLHANGQAVLPGLGVGQLAEQVLAGSGVQARVLGGDSACETAAGSRTTAGVLIRFPLPELGSIPAGGGINLVVGSTSATAGASSVPSDDVPLPDSPPVFGDVVTRLPGPFSGGGPLAPVTPGSPGVDGTAFPTEEAAAYAFDGVPGSLLIGGLLLALVAAAHLRRYLRRIIALIGPS
jgi:hypothetical protein